MRGSMSGRSGTRPSSPIAPGVAVKGGMKGPASRNGITRENPAANLKQMAPQGFSKSPTHTGTKAASPIGPGNPKSVSAPDRTWKQVGSPTGPGTPKSVRSPDNTRMKVTSPTGPGTPKSKPSAKFGGVPGREGGAKPQAAKPKAGMNGQKGSGKMSAAGMVPPANKMGPGMVKGAKGVRY